jgi:hypothetical protein
LVCNWLGDHSYSYIRCAFVPPTHSHFDVDGTSSQLAHRMAKDSNENVSKVKKTARKSSNKAVSKAKVRLIARKRTATEETHFLLKQVLRRLRKLEEQNRTVLKDGSQLCHTEYNAFGCLEVSVEELVQVSDSGQISSLPLYTEVLELLRELCNDLQVMFADGSNRGDDHVRPRILAFLRRVLHGRNVSFATDVTLARYTTRLQINDSETKDSGEADAVLCRTVLPFANAVVKSPNQSLMDVKIRAQGACGTQVSREKLHHLTGSVPRFFVTLTTSGREWMVTRAINKPSTHSGVTYPVSEPFAVLNLLPQPNGGTRTRKMSTTLVTALVDEALMAKAAKILTMAFLDMCDTYKAVDECVRDIIRCNHLTVQSSQQDMCGHGVEKREDVSSGPGSPRREVGGKKGSGQLGMNFESRLVPCYRPLTVQNLEQHDGMVL